MDDMKEFYTALAAMQAEIPIVQKNKAGRFKYADIAEIVDQTRPILTKHGFSVIQTFSYIRETGVTLLNSILTHTSGDCISSEIPLSQVDASQLKGMTSSQAVGSDITYLRRYAYCALIGVVVSDEDYDGNYSTQDQACTEGQYNFINSLLSKLPQDQRDEKIRAMLGHYKISDLKELSVEQASMIIEKLKGK